MESTISILIACPRTLVTELLATAFSANPGFSVAAHVSSQPEIISALENSRIDLVLLDEELSGRDHGLELLHLIRRCAPHARSVLLQDRHDRQHIVDCFKAGARGVFSKFSSDFNLLCKCLRAVHAGQFWASNEELGWIIDALGSVTTRSTALRVINAQGENLFSRREEDVVRLIMEGMSNRDIAKSLELSEHTIKNYLFRIFDKLGVSSRTELLLYAMNFRLDEPASSRHGALANAS